MGRPGWDAGSAISAPWVAALNAVSGNTTARTPLTSLSVFTSDALAVAQNSPVGFSFADWYGRDTMQAIASYRSLDRTVGLPTTPVVAPLDFPATTVREPTVFSQFPCYGATLSHCCALVAP